MKKNLAFVLVVATFIFISPFSVSAGAEEEWNKELNLSDSVSSSIIKLDDGLVVMQYEGGASTNNVLKKYDFDGNEVWTIKNEYGYEIGALSDGFLVYSNYFKNIEMTKISSDGKALWKKSYNSNFASYSNDMKLVSFDTGFVIYDTKCIYLFDNNGNLLKELLKSDVANTVFGRSSTTSYNFSISLSSDRQKLLIYLDDRYYSTGPGTGYYHAIAEYSLNLDYKTSTIAYSGNQLYRYLTKVVETDNNYIITGNFTLVFNKKGQIDKALNVAMVDIEYIDGYIYAYVAKEDESYGIYRNYIGKYDENMNKVAEYPLSASFNRVDYTSPDMNFLGLTSFAALKNRNVFYNDSDGIHFVLLNSALLEVISGGVRLDNYYSFNYDYGIAQYRLIDDSSNIPVADDGIIDNIFENPETSSIAAIIVFVVVILVGGVGFYLGYKKRNVKNT